MMNKNDRLELITPGEIIREDFLAPLGISINRLSRDLAVPPNRISEIL
jgi:addiction module HigA family antidote